MIKKPSSADRPGFKSKREEMRARRQRRELVTRLVIAGVVVAVVAGAAAFWYSTRRPAAIPGEQSIPDEGQGHVPQDSPVTFNHYPPSSGNHYPTSMAWGVYTDEIPEGNWVHNLEHGGIVILYNCPPEGCADLQAELAEVAKVIPEDPTFGEQKVLVTPYSRALESKIVLLAWTVQLNLDDVDRETIIQFYRRHVNQAPELVR